MVRKSSPFPVPRCQGTERRAGNRQLVSGNVRRALAALICAILVASGCSRQEQKRQAAAATGGGDVARGKVAIDRYGCTACHTIPGIEGPKGMVGPPLDHIASRPVIAGKFPNNPQTLVKWLQNPPAFDPQSAMPNLGITPTDARDITAYLETLK